MRKGWQKLVACGGNLKQRLLFLSTLRIWKRIYVREDIELEEAVTIEGFKALKDLCA